MNKFLLFITLLAAFNTTSYLKSQRTSNITGDNITAVLNYLLQQNNIQIAGDEPQSIINNFVQQIASNPEISNKPDKVEAILNTFVGMLHSFSHVLSDPKNPTVVGPNLAHMLAGIITIAMQAKRNKINGEKIKEKIKALTDNNEQEKELEKLTQKLIKKVVTICHE
jgi:hypothetical protein